MFDLFRKLLPFLARNTFYKLHETFRKYDNVSVQHHIKIKDYL